jgi:hypothetical protein
LLSQLSNDDNIIDVKFKEKSYLNGNTKCQSVCVKLKNDPVNRYWLVGRYFYYYKNGQLKERGHVNIRTKTFCDTSFIYEENGDLKKMIIYNNQSTYSVVYEPMFKIFNNCYHCYPDQYKTIIYKNGNIIHEYEKVYNQKLGFYEQKNEKRYNEKGELIDKVPK